MKTSNNLSTVEKLVKFVNQRPNLEFCNYGDIKLYRQESREITQDRADFYELLNLAYRRIDNLEEVLLNYLKNSSNRLTINESGNLQYITGQYFPTEYRPAAARVIANILWNDYRTEKDSKGEQIYKDGNDIRKAAKRNLRRRTVNLYFN
jgi:hypothetical protein